MSESTHYSLQILRIQDLVWKPKLHGKLPDLYVKVKLDDNTQQRQTVKVSAAPNTKLTFSSSDVSTVLNIRVKHNSSCKLWKNPCVGCVNIKLIDLLSECANGMVQLDLLPASGKLSSFPGGVIHLHLETIDLTSKANDVMTVGQAEKIQDAESTANTFAGGVAQLGEWSDLYQSIGKLLSNLDVIVKVIDDISGIHPYLSAAWQATSVLYKIISKQFETDRKILDLAHTMEKAFEFAHDSQSLRNKTRVLESSIIELLKLTTDCCRFIEEYTANTFAGRVLDLSARKQIDDFSQLLRECKTDLDSRLTLHNAVILDQVAGEVNAGYLRQLLLPNEMYAHDRPTCHKDTSVEIRQKIINWLKSDTSLNILWLHGVAGSGKSTITSTLADYFRDLHQLGAFLFFERGSSEPSSVIRTVAFKLALFDSSIGSHITDRINLNKDIVSAKADRQFEDLLLHPLAAAASSIKEPVLIILDALDECGTLETRKELLQTIKQGFPKLPKKFRFLITSRREQDINRALSSQPEFVRPMELDFTSAASRRDVLSYIRDEMDRKFRSPESEVRPPAEWPWDTNMDLLGDTAEGLFIWGSTAVKLVVTHDNPFQKLEDLVLHSSSLNGFGLDDLYATALRHSGISWNDSVSRDRFSQVLGLILLSKTPLSVAVIDGILGFPHGKSSSLILSRLQSVLVYTCDAPIRLFHTSFSDYLMASNSSADPWFIDVRAQMTLLTTRCFCVMKNMLDFNMCNLKTSFVQNNDVVGLEDRIKNKILPHLEYACLFWAQHLREASFAPALLDELSDFVYIRLLYWLEALSLLKKVDLAGPALVAAIAWTTAHDTGILAFLKDARRLVSVFLLPISQATPHLYLSAIPVASKESKVAAHFLKQTSSMVQIDRRGVKLQSHLLKRLEGHSSWVRSVSFSHDGRRIVSGSADKTIRVWDAESGQVVYGPFEGHKDYVRSVAFSPDSTHIVSGSWDKTVSVWDVESGKVVSEPFKGHTYFVLSVAFSPDGTRVVSGSMDNTIMVWSVESGQAVSGPFREHTDSVQSVAFSPDGKLILSGSNDKSIIVSNAESGKVVFGPFKGHKDFVRSVAFSRDGKRIVSGSRDKTVIVWDTENVKVISGPFEGHSASIWSVAFSPDGSRVASGSEDNTIRVWDVESGQVVFESFKGHSDAVESVAFSPDGTRIVSGSRDKTIRIWDAESGQVDSGPFEGHRDDIQSVAFSPDGKRIVSASKDKTIIVWDMESVKVVSGPLKGHTGRIWSVAFSHDGTRIVSGSLDKTVRIWDAESGKAVAGPFEGHANEVLSVAFSPDSTLVASGSMDNTIRVWDAKNGQLISGPFEEHTNDILSIAFSPDGTRIASGSMDNTVRVWDVESGRVVSGPFRGHTDNVQSVAFSPDGKSIISGSEDRTIRVWDAESGKVISEPFEGHMDDVSSIAFSPDCSRIVSGSLNKTITIWDVKSGQVVSGPFKGHTGSVGSVAFSPNGTQIVSGSEDRSIRVWEVENGKADFGHSEGDTPAVSFETSPDINSTWILAEDGWILGAQHELLLWIPHHLRPTLCYPGNTAVFNCAFSTRLDFIDTAHGEHWTECFSTS